MSKSSANSSGAEPTSVRASLAVDVDASHAASTTVQRERKLRLVTLDDLRRLPPPRLVPPGVSVEVALPGLDEGLRLEFERRLGEQLKACGCNEAALAVLAYVSMLIALVLLGLLAPTSLGAWFGLLGGLIAASVLGKVAGLTVANVRLRRIAAELMRSIESQGEG